MSTATERTAPGGTTSEIMASSLSAGAAPVSLRTNFSWTLLGNLVLSICSWGVVVLLAKLGSPEIVGQYSLAVAVVTPVITFAQLQLRAIQATDVRRGFLFQHYFGLRTAATALSLAVVAGVILFGDHRGAAALLILLVAAAESVESISDIFYGLFQRQERMDRISTSQVARGLLSLGAMAALLVLTGSAAWGVVGMLGARLLVFLAYDLPMGKRTIAAIPGEHVAPAFSLRVLWALFLLALPMGLTLMLNAVGANVSRYLIAGFLGERELGLFAASASLVAAGRTIVGALGQTASPRLARYFAAGDTDHYWRLLGRLVGITTLVGLLSVGVGWLIGREVLTMLFRPEYGEHVDLLLWLLAGGAVANISMWGGVGLTAARQFRIQLPLAFFSIVCSLGANWWLIPKQGLIGAGEAALVAALLSTGAVFLVTKRAVAYGVRQRRRL